MRVVTIILVVLLALLQYPLWWGRGGWLSVRGLQHQLVGQQQRNAQDSLRNERMAGEVQGLQEGTDAIDERARYEMGMMKDGEVFVQFVPPSATASSVSLASGFAPGATPAHSRASAKPAPTASHPVSGARAVQAKKRDTQKKAQEKR